MEQQTPVSKGVFSGFFGFTRLHQVVARASTHLKIARDQTQSLASRIWGDYGLGGSRLLLRRAWA